MATAGARISYFDGWRGLAVALVLLGHFLPVPGINLGNLGVELFFGLSGLLMAEILFVKRFPLAEFFYRRVSRIVPALWIFLAISWLALRDTDLAFGPLAALTAATFTLNYAVIYSHQIGALDHIWSLCVEEHAYIILGLVALLLRRDRAWTTNVIGLIAAAAMINGVVRAALFGADGIETFWRTDVHIASIFAAAFFHLKLKDKAVPVWLSPICFVVGVALFAVGPEWLIYSLGALLLSLSVVTLDRGPELMKQALSSRALTSLGLVSYSVYLWQQPFYLAAEENPGLTLPLLVAAVGVGICSYFLVEKTSRKALNDLWGAVVFGFRRFGLAIA